MVVFACRKILGSSPSQSLLVAPSLESIPKADWQAYTNRQPKPSHPNLSNPPKTSPQASPLLSSSTKTRLSGHESALRCLIPISRRLHHPELSSHSLSPVSERPAVPSIYSISNTPSHLQAATAHTSSLLPAPAQSTTPRPFCS